MTCGTLRTNMPCYQNFHFATIVFLKIPYIMGSIQFSQKCLKLVSIKRSGFLWPHNSEGGFVGARVVEKSMEKGVEKSRQQGFPLVPMENPIDYGIVSMGDFRPITK